VAKGIRGNDIICADRNPNFIRILIMDTSLKIAGNAPFRNRCTVILQSAYRKWGKEGRAQSRFETGTSQIRLHKAELQIFWQSCLVNQLARSHAEFKQFQNYRSIPKKESIFTIP